MALFQLPQVVMAHADVVVSLVGPFALAGHFRQLTKHWKGRRVLAGLVVRESGLE